MTAINVCVPRDGSRGYMLVDTIVYDRATGAAVGFAAKTLTVPHCGCVVAMRGLVSDCTALAPIVGRFQSFDDVVAGAGPALAKAFAELEATKGPRAVDAVVMGFSERALRVKAFMLSSRDEPAFRLAPADVVISPDLVAEDLDALGLLSGAGRMRIKDPPRDLLRIMEAQRRSLAATEHIPIGGHAVLTEISAAGIAQRVIHQWDDAPARGDARAEYAGQRAAAVLSRRQAGDLCLR